MNPFYLVSAASMLAGCYLLSGAASKEAGGLAHVLWVLGWLTAYELLLSGIAAFLGRRGLARDSRTLLVLAAIFLTDPTHLAGETVSWSGRGWAGAALLLLGLGIGKIALVQRLFRVRLERRALLPLVGILALVIFLPGAFLALARRGADLELPLYGMAWVLGLVLVMQTLRERPAGVTDETSPSWAVTAFTSTLDTALPISVAAHVLALHWLYDVPFSACSLTPPLLALALVVTRSPHAPEKLRLRLALPAIAVLFSLGWPGAFAFGTFVTFSPLRAALLVAGVVYLYDYLRHRQIVFLALPSACAAVAVAGHTLSASLTNIVHIFDVVFVALDRVLPRSRQQWGALAMAASYAILGFGAWISFKRRAAARP
jgi:hypothetical protein